MVNLFFHFFYRPMKTEFVNEVMVAE